MTNPSRVPLIEPELTGSIIAAYYKVYNTLGTGFSEHVYAAAFTRELSLRGHRVRREHLVAV
jgi:GxxExxY protein